jgi:hypothetical protein
MMLLRSVFLGISAKLPKKYEAIRRKKYDGGVENECVYTSESMWNWKWNFM